MSTIKHWHIALVHELNKVNSSLYDILTPQEIDFAFNKNILRFVKQRYGPLSNPKQKGFEQSQKRIDDLRTLVVANYRTKAFLPDSYDVEVNSKVVAYLPSDHLVTLNTRMLESYDPCADIAPTTTTTNSTGYYLKYIEIPISTLNFATWDQLTITTTVNGTIYNFSLGTAASVYTREDDSLGIKMMMDTINLFGPTSNNDLTHIQAYYEKAYNLYKPGSIILVYAYPTFTSLTASTTIGTATPVTKTVETLSFTFYNEIASQTVTSGKQVQQDDLYAMMVDPFNTTVVDFPLYFFHSNTVSVMIVKNKFVVNDIVMSYLRIPKTVSYYLNINCDLPEGVHDEIISMTANYLLEEFEAQRYQSHKETVITNE